MISGLLLERVRIYFQGLRCLQVPHVKVLQVLEILKHGLGNPLELVITDRKAPQLDVVLQSSIGPGSQSVLAEVEYLNLGERLHDVRVQRGLVLVLAPVTDPVPHQGAGHVEFPEAGQVDGQGPSPRQAETENQNERGEQRLTWRG